MSQPVKPTVRYKDAGPIVVGESVFLHPVDHTSPLVSNECLARTSKVVADHGDGKFETLNTMYVPA